MTINYRTTLDDLKNLIRSEYVPKLRRAYNCAWDYEVPTQKMVDGLTITVQKAISDIKQKFKTQAIQESTSKSNAEEEIKIIWCRFQHLRPQDHDDPKPPPPRLVSRNEFKPPFEEKD